MKYAAGCFGCLALVFLALSLLTGTIVSQLAQAIPDQGAMIVGLSAPFQYVNSGCCCLSGVLAIALFAIGSMGSKDPVE